MNAYIAPAQTPAPTRRHRATAPWVLALLSPVTFVVLMETLEGIAMSGSGPEIPDAVGLPIYFVLVALLPAAVLRAAVLPAAVSMSAVLKAAVLPEDSVSYRGTIRLFQQQFIIHGITPA